MTELPDEIRVPLHELQADVDYLIGRVVADGSCAPAMAVSIKQKLSAIETAIQSRAPAQGASDWQVAVDLTEKDILAEYYSGRLNGDSRIREGFKNLRAALAAQQPAAPVETAGIEELKAQIDTLTTAMQAPTKEEIALRERVAELEKEAAAAHAEVVQTQDELGALLHSAEAKLAAHTSSSAETARQPTVVDFDDGEISVRLDGKELRGWSYKDDIERRVKMLAAREYVEGWCDGRDAR